MGAAEDPCHGKPHCGQGADQNDQPGAGTVGNKGKKVTEKDYESGDGNDGTSGIASMAGIVSASQ